MHILRVHFEDAEINGSGDIDFRSGKFFIRKWTIWPDSRQNIERLKLLAVVCIDGRLLLQLKSIKPPTCRSDADGLRLEFIIAKHAPRDIMADLHPVIASGFLLSRDGVAEALKKDNCRHISSDIPFRLIR